MYSAGVRESHCIVNVFSFYFFNQKAKNVTNENLYLTFTQMVFCSELFLHVASNDSLPAVLPFQPEGLPLPSLQADPLIHQRIVFVFHSFRTI